MNAKEIMNSKEFQGAININGDNEDWDQASYLVGVYNGTELMLSIVEGRAPIFVTSQEDFLDKEELIKKHPYINKESELLMTRRDINEGQRDNNISKGFR